jgi:Secretion system C-terminal sorting domain/Beta-propeller repeat
VKPFFYPIMQRTVIMKFFLIVSLTVLSNFLIARSQGDALLTKRYRLADVYWFADGYSFVEKIQIADGLVYRRTDYFFRSETIRFSQSGDSISYEFQNGSQCTFNCNSFGFDRVVRHSTSDVLLPSRPLIQQPEIQRSSTSTTDLLYSTFLGGSDTDEPASIAACADGSVVVCGRTASVDFPVTDTVTYRGGYDLFVAKMSATGARLWAYYWGGSGYDAGWDVEVQDSVVVVIGATNSNDITIPGAFQDTLAGSYDAIILVLDTSGVMLRATFFGGTGGEQGLGVAVSDNFNVIICGSATSLTLPMSASGLYPNNNGTLDAFICRMDINLQPQWSTFFGGTGGEDIHDVVILNNQEIAFCGGSFSNNFPTTSNAYQQANMGIPDVYVVRLDMNGALLYATLIGGSANEDANGIAADSAGNLYITGITYSALFPIEGPAIQANYSGNGDAFVFKMNTSGNVVWSTFLGGSLMDAGMDIDVQGKYVYLSGTTESTTFPVTPGSFSDTLTGGNDVYVLKLDTAGALVLGTFVGGSNTEFNAGCTVTADTVVFITGTTYSSNFPTYLAWDAQYSGIGDGFVTAVDMSWTPFTSAIIGSESFNSILVYPNPVQDILTIENLHPGRLTVFDARGRILFDQEMNEGTIHLHTGLWQSGIYIVQSRNEQGVLKSIKVVK